MLPFDRPLIGEVRSGLMGKPDFIHILLGPRQVGKSTLARSLAADWIGPVVTASADGLGPPGPEWVATHWARVLATRSQQGRALLILDEIQKVDRWAEAVKKIWDDMAGDASRPALLLLGSSALQVQRGLGESLAGRYVVHRLGHWPWDEMRRAFDFTLDEWIYFGGYPGAAAFRDTPDQWATYITDSLIEAALARDVLQMHPVNKPALLRHLFALAAGYPAQILSYNKMLGQLQDAGNTTTLAHYLRLLETAFLVSGLESFYGGGVQRRASSPKLILWNNALVNALSGRDPVAARSAGSWWGRLVENAVGGHLLNHLHRTTHHLHYWRQRGAEVDFVIQTPRTLWGLEVKSSPGGRISGLKTFLNGHPQARSLIVGGNGMPLEEFFSTDPTVLLH